MLYNVCVFIYKILNNTLVSVLRNRIKIIESGSERQTRQAGNIVLEFRKIKSARKSVFWKELKCTIPCQPE